MDQKLEKNPYLWKGRASLLKKRIGKSLVLIGCFFWGISWPSFGQGSGAWQQLAQVSYRSVPDPASGYQVDVPVFGKEVKALEGKRIKLKGFMVPLDYLLKKQYFVLSSMPFNLCFFCGGAGPETVVEVNTQSPVKLTEDLVWVEGVFEINEDDPEQLMYILRQATVKED